jgi:tRNA(Ile)-lysidine synthase
VPGSPPLLRKLVEALDATGGPTRDEHLLVAVSGGPDSTALLAALAELAPARGLRLTAAHIDHGLRGAEGAREGTAVARLAARLGVAFVGRKTPVATGGDLEARARRARYIALRTIADEVGASRIVTAHTLDDQAETVLFRLLRGTGRRGLGGMRPERPGLLRPLLGVTRADVRRFLADRELSHAVDRTNADLRFVRNRIRRVLLPFLESEFNPRLREALGALAARLRDEDDLLTGAARRAATRLVDARTLGVAVAAEPPALARRIVRAWLVRAARRGASAAHVERVLALAATAGRGPVSVPGPGRVVREGDRLVGRAGRAPAREALRLPIRPGESVAHPGGAWRLTLSVARTRQPGEARARGPAHALFDADALPGVLAVRSPVPGDRLRVLGGGTRKLQDVLVDAKVPREARVDVPVLVAGAEVLWVAGLVRGAGAALGPATTRVVEGVLERGA